MKNVGWTLLIVIMLMCQILILIMLMDKKTREDRNASIVEQTLLMNNQAAALNLETEKLRNHYYQVLQHTDMFPSADYGKENKK